LIHSTDTTVTTHDGGESVEGWLLAAPSAFKVTIRSLHRRSKVDGKSIQTKLGSDAVRLPYGRNRWIEPLSAGSGRSPSGCRKRRRTQFIPLPLFQTRETDSANERNEFRLTGRPSLSVNQRLDRFQALVGPNAKKTTFPDPGHTSERPTVGWGMSRRWTCIAVPSRFRVSGQSMST
jgi:hypothetical protein